MQHARVKPTDPIDYDDDDGDDDGDDDDDDDDDNDDNDDDCDDDGDDDDDGGDEVPGAATPRETEQTAAVLVGSSRAPSRQDSSRYREYSPRASRCTRRCGGG